LVVVNHNTHQGLKLVKGATYMGLDVILDKVCPGHRIEADITVHFGPPAGIILESETTSTSIKIQCQRKRSRQQNEVTRKGLPCAATFACTDYKVQGKTLERIALEGRGRQISMDASSVANNQART
ncbi:hypothetical protein F5883DRAFT_436061, partial [Diaporthe sp. PMI_573]